MKPAPISGTENSNRTMATMRTLTTTLAMLAFAGAAMAQAPAAPGLAPPAIEPGPPGTIPWPLLFQAKTVQKPDKKFGPVFTAEIKALDQKDVKLYGFMMPLDQSAKQKRFLLSPYPPHCTFCLSGGPESLVEVLASKPVDFTYEPIVVSGRMAVLEDDVVYYRLTNAAQAKP